MSTRSNVLINGESDIWLYRHHDGYLAESGQAILRAVAGLHKHYTCMAGPRYAANKLIKMTDCSYELTGEQHGDIDHLYVLRWSGRGLMIGHSERTADHDPRSNWCVWSTPEQFVELVNGERRVINRRMDQRQMDGERYHMIDVNGEELVEVAQ